MFLLTSTSLEPQPTQVATPSCSAVLLQLAAQAGATDESGGSVLQGAVCFTHSELQEFGVRLLAHQRQLLERHVPEAALLQELNFVAQQMGLPRFSGRPG